jgi:hypothetical protein
MISAFLALAILKPTYRADCDIFVLKDCPIANHYAPELKRIIQKNSPKGIQFMMIVEDADATPQQVFMYAKSFGYTIPMRLDENHHTAKQLGVTISPTAVVSRDSKVFYRGRIDDTYPSVGKRHVASTHELRDALDALLAGKRVKRPVTQPVGCRLY